MSLLKGLPNKSNICYNRSSCQRFIQSRTQSPRALGAASGGLEKLWNIRRKSNFFIGCHFTTSEAPAQILWKFEVHYPRVSHDDNLLSKEPEHSRYEIAVHCNVILFIFCLYSET